METTQKRVRDMQPSFLPRTRPVFAWRLRSRLLALGERTMLMGIVNITPDSFSDGGRYLATEAAVGHASSLLDEGADLLDLGGESTRPDATPITPEQEQARVLPVLAAILKARPGTIVSVDTYHSATAQAALDLGAEVINDVSGLLWDRKMAQVISHGRPGAVLMHTRGTPQQWRNLSPLTAEDVLPLVGAGLEQTLATARQAGIPGESIVLDPGFGFGKLGHANDTLLAGLHTLHDLGYPILTGTSRKRFLTASIAMPTEVDRTSATTAAHVACVLSGAHILRVHDIAAARGACLLADRILAAR